MNAAQTTVVLLAFLGTLVVVAFLGYALGIAVAVTA